jgi:hypothetical protein
LRRRKGKHGERKRGQLKGKAESLKSVTKEGKLVFLFFRKVRRKESPIKQSQEKLSFCPVNKSKSLPFWQWIKAEGKRSGKHGRKAKGKKEREAGRLPLGGISGASELA